MTPPKLHYTLPQAQAIIEGETGIVVSRQTVYNWAKKGARGTKLRTRTIGGKVVTTMPWIKEFLDAS